MTKGTRSRIWLGLALLTLAVSLSAGLPPALADASEQSAQSGDQAKKAKQEPAEQKSPAALATKDAAAPAPAAAGEDDATCKPRMRFNTLEDVYGAGNLARRQVLPEAPAPAPQQLTWRLVPLAEEAAQRPVKPETTPAEAPQEKATKKEPAKS